MLLERTESLHEPHIPVLETGRLVLRAPRLDDAERVAALVNDRRIAENTARIPHPYALADAESWIGASNRTAGEATFVIETGGEVIGGCGFDLREGLLDRRAVLGQRLCNRSRAGRDRLRLWRTPT